MLQMLIVDDDPDVCETMKFSLEDYCGATVWCSATGTAAIEVLNNQRVDAAVIDVDLPRITGFEVAERAANLNVPVLLTAGHPDAIRLCTHFAYPHLAKPFSPSALAEEAIHIIRQAAENIVQVRHSCAELKATAASLTEAIQQAKRMVARSIEITDRVKR